MKNNKLDVKTYVLAFIETFSVWQMGIIYYSSKTLTINNSNPLPVVLDNSIFLVITGYILGILFIYLFPKKTVFVGRLLMFISLIASIILFFNIPSLLFKILYYVLTFNCVFFISINTSLLINLYSLKSALMDAIVGAIITGIMIAICQNNIIPFNFIMFNTISSICLLLITFALFKLPIKMNTIFLSKSDKLKIPPKQNIIGLIIIQIICCLSTLFTATLSESIGGGISMSYLGLFISGLICYILYKNDKLNPFKVCKYYFGICSIGFVLFLIPNNITNYISLFLQGFGLFNILVAPFLISHLFAKYPSKLIAPITVIICLLTVIINSLLVESFRLSSTFLYLIYSILSIINVVIYLMIEPNLELQSLCNSNKNKLLKKITKLSKREIEVTELLINGYSNKEIASKLNISNYTVNDHIKNIYKKYDVHSRMELAIIITNKS
ncbi:MAG: LuxR C-terminal-related transcriptional regulator [bacterium]|nr:LuxR C-terminal-related transcriptional regulator [bacterium]